MIVINYIDEGHHHTYPSLFFHFLQKVTISSNLLMREGVDAMTTYN
jgi:hypothetical protein